MTHFPLVDLYFTYQDGPPKLCFEVCGLAEDEIEVFLGALKRRLNQTEPEAYQFSTKGIDDYSRLELVKRQDGGDWADSGIEGEADQLAVGMGLQPSSDLTDDARRWVDVHNTAHALSGEINQLRVKLNCHQPVKASILPCVGRDELLEHLDDIDCSPPKLPSIPPDKLAGGQATWAGSETVQSVQSSTPAPSSATGTAADPSGNSHMPVGWFKDEFGLTAEALRGQVRRKNLGVKKRGCWNLYSVADAKRIWPQLVTYGPDDTR